MKKKYVLIEQRKKKERGKYFKEKEIIFNK